MSLCVPQNIDQSDIHATSLSDITGDIQTIIDGVRNITSHRECCNYELQLLDKFCATQDQVRP